MYFTTLRPLKTLIPAAILAGLILANHGTRANPSGRSSALEPSPPARPPAPAPFSKPISYSLLEDYDKGADLHEVALDFELMNALGIDTWRGSFGWDDYEPERGRYDFAWLHAFADLAADYGIKLRPYLGYTAPWAAAGGRDGSYWNDPPRRLQDWYDFVFHLTKALSVHDNILSYEIYNEVNDALWWDGSRLEYSQVLETGAEAIRAGDPDAEILMAGLIFADYDWIDTLCSRFGLGSSFDIAPLHAYPETWWDASITVENYLSDQYYDWYLPAVQDDCGGQPVWINELGFATTPGRSEARQADWWARAFATFLAAPGIEHLGIYELKDLEHEGPVIGDAANYDLGLTNVDRTPKKAWYTVQMLVGLLPPGSITVADGQLTATVTAGAALEPYYHLFKRPDGRQILFAYDRRGSPTADLRLTTPGTSAIAYTLDGSSQPFPAFDGLTLRGVALVPGTVRIFEILP